MILLGSERNITQNFITHNSKAEDYAGNHKSVVKLPLYGRVIKVVNKYKSYIDTINSNEFNNNKNKWKDGLYYNCVCIGGNVSRFHQSELGGNSITVEFTHNNSKYTATIAHLDSVKVKVGDIINKDTIIGYQGNTGLVLSGKSRSDNTYGSHIHFEVMNNLGNYINPREFAIGINNEYIEQSNEIDDSKEQIKIKADKINIRALPSTSSTDLGDVYNGDIYTVLSKTEDTDYIWYKINTSNNIIGYIAGKKTENWIELIPPDIEAEPEHKVSDEIEKETELNNNLYIKVFTCIKTDMYAIKINKGEELYIKKN